MEQDVMLRVWHKRAQAMPIIANAYGTLPAVIARGQDPEDELSCIYLCA
jgi:hypothetical protein